MRFLVPSPSHRPICDRLQHVDKYAKTDTVLAKLTTVRSFRNEARCGFVRRMGGKSYKDEAAHMVAS